MTRDAVILRKRIATNRLTEVASTALMKFRTRTFSSLIKVTLQDIENPAVVDGS
jgi:hypothetical protein